MATRENDVFYPHGERNYKDDPYSPPRRCGCPNPWKAFFWVGVIAVSVLLIWHRLKPKPPSQTWQECVEEKWFREDDAPQAVLRLETVMTVSRILFGFSLDAIGAVVGRPINNLLYERLQAASLRPMVRRLLEGEDVSISPGPNWAKTALTDACQMLPVDGGVPCPQLQVVESEAGRRIDTLPSGVFRRHHIIFISKGLLTSGARPVELQALFARELGHLLMGHWHMPRSWLMLQAAGVSNRAQKAWDQIPSDINDDLRKAWAQMIELCRANSAAIEAARRARLLGKGFERLNSAGDAWLSMEGHMGTLVDVCHVMEAPGSTAVKVQLVWTIIQKADFGFFDRFRSRGRRQVSRRDWGRSKNQAPDLSDMFASVASMDSKKVKRSLRRLGHDLRSFEVDWIGLAKAAIRAWKPILLLMLSMKRVTELAADREAVRSFDGRIEPVVAGLVRLHGSAEECRRIDRGDVVGIIDGARAALNARSGLLRWELWWRGMVDGPTDPFLVLRIADLAAWAQLPGEEGRFVPWRATIKWNAEIQEEAKPRPR